MIMQHVTTVNWDYYNNILLWFYIETLRIVFIIKCIIIIILL